MNIFDKLNYILLQFALRKWGLNKRQFKMLDKIEKKKWENLLKYE